MVAGSKAAVRRTLVCCDLGVLQLRLSCTGLNERAPFEIHRKGINAEWAKILGQKTSDRSSLRPTTRV